MSDPAADLLTAIQRELAPRDNENRLIPLVEKGRAPKAALASLGVEELSIIESDRRLFLVTAARSVDSSAIDFFTNLALGEGLALAKLPAYIAACGWSQEKINRYQPRADCQTYPAYVTWLGVNGDPVDVTLALLANFAAWGTYCSAMAKALRTKYGFDNQACGFFDFFATPTPDLDAMALSAIRNALDNGHSFSRAFRFARLLQHFELQFWNSLADIHR